MFARPKRILWPTDFSELSLSGASCAAAFRELFDAELHVIHVLTPPMAPDLSATLVAEVPIALPESELLGSTRTGLTKLVNERFPGVKAVVDSMYGNPWSTICEYARRENIDLIIVATHGRTGLSHALIGSTAERIVRHAACPVLVVKSPERKS